MPQEYFHAAWVLDVSRLAETVAADFAQEVAEWSVLNAALPPRQAQDRH